MKIKPISLQFSILIFGSAALLFLLIERIVVPYLAHRGLDPSINFLILGAPHILFFIGAFYKKTIAYADPNALLGFCPHLYRNSYKKHRRAG